MFYTIFKAPVLLNIGFGVDENSNESQIKDAGSTQEFDYYIDQQFDINTFCKTVLQIYSGQQQVQPGGGSSIRANIVRSAQLCYLPKERLEYLAEGNAVPLI